MSWWLSLWLNALIPILLAGVTNGIIYALGWNDKQRNTMKKSEFIPPGWVIAIVWTFILALLGVVNHLALSSQDYVSFSMVCLIMASCIAYPFYTNGLSNDRVALYGNVSTMFLSYIVYTIVVVRIVKATPLMLPLLGWTTYVTMVSFYEAKGEK